MKPSDYHRPFRQLVNRYLDENEPLDDVAIEFARLWARKLEYNAILAKSKSLNPDPRILSYIHFDTEQLRPDASVQDGQRLKELIAAASVKLLKILNGAV